MYIYIYIYFKISTKIRKQFHIIFKDNYNIKPYLGIYMLHSKKDHISVDIREWDALKIDGDKGRKQI